jgi:hypothetical protein
VFHPNLCRTQYMAGRMKRNRDAVYVYLFAIRDCLKRQFRAQS